MGMLFEIACGIFFDTMKKLPAAGMQPAGDFVDFGSVRESTGWIEPESLRLVSDSYLSILGLDWSGTQSIDTNQRLEYKYMYK